MSSDKYENIDCPYCKEEIKADAIKCKHCGSKLATTRPSHEGTCPYCKEEIHKEAIKCKHCQSILTAEIPTELEVFQSKFPSTLPKCRVVRKLCGSSLPGFPPIYCYDYVCRYGGVDTIINSWVVSRSLT